MIQNNMRKYNDLRNEYDYFEYQSYSFKLDKNYIEATFNFNIAGKHFFKPQIKIPIRSFYNKNILKNKELSNFVFHIGMVELVSYWKATCSPKVIITPHFLDNKQIVWWKKLYFNGLGEFFYLNGIDTNEDIFMSVSVSEKRLIQITTILDDEKVIVPIGGGKDSVVTLELLTGSRIPVIPMMVNPREASVRTIETSGYTLDESIVINRTIDSNLLELNKLGFLNGHTPFSALLAFTGALSCEISEIANIALSNESSANESTVRDSKINHQYSKSFEFENDFNWYLKKYLNPNIKYFSFLRPVNELQIANLFSKFPKHFAGFRSCNVGSKDDVWCCNCSKCLFTYIILSPFIETEKLVEIFGTNMLENKKLKPIYNQLTGVSDTKPFECVGTVEEVNAALYSHQHNAINSLTSIMTNKNIKKESSYKKLISSYNEEHLVPERFEVIIKNALND